MTFKAKTTATVDKELGSITVQFAKASEELKSAVSSANGIELIVAGLKETFETTKKGYNDLIEQSEQKIAALEEQFKEKERTLKVDVDLKIKEHGINQAVAYLSATHAVVEKSDYAKLQEQIKEANKTTAEAVAAKQATLTAEHKAEILKLSSEHTVKESENVARIRSLESINAMLEKQVLDLKSMIDKDRDANTERAKASSVGAINVSSGK